MGLMQKVAEAVPLVNVQQELLVASVQSVETWQSCVFDVSLHVPMCVTHAAAEAHDAPREETPQFGNVPVPLPTATAQQIGVAVPHSSGPSHVNWSPAGQLAGAVQAKGEAAPGVTQHTVLSGQAGPAPQPKS